MSIHWRNWSGARIGTEETARSAESVAFIARALRREGAGEGRAFVISGDTLFAALAEKGRDDVEVYEARIVRVGEEARRRSDAAPEPEAKTCAHEPKCQSETDHARRIARERLQAMRFATKKLGPGLLPWMMESMLDALEDLLDGKGVGPRD